jgi:uncharacterized protein
MLRIDLRVLDQGPVEVAGSLAPDDPLWTGLGFELIRAVRVSGQVAGAGDGRYYWRGQLSTAVRGQCRRCLAPVDVTVAAPVEVLFTDDELADDPSARVIERQANVLDLSDTVREELILSVPEYVLCREECRGLCPGCGQDLNAGSCGCQPSTDPRWGPLERLRRLLPDEPR